MDFSFPLRRLPWIPGQSRYSRSFLDALVTLDATILFGSFSVEISSLPVALITSSTIILCNLVIFCVILQWTYRSRLMPDYPCLVKSESVLFTAFFGLPM